MYWKQFGGIDNPSTHILPQGNTANKAIYEIDANILRIGNTRLLENKQNGLWFKGLGHSDLSLSDYSDDRPNTVIEERYYNPITGDSEMLLLKSSDTAPALINPYVDTSFNMNSMRGDRIRIKAPSIVFDTYDAHIEDADLHRSTENARVVIDHQGRVGVNTLHPGQTMDIHGKMNVQSSKSKTNIYLSNNADPDPADHGTNNIGIGAYVFSDPSFNCSHNIALGHDTLKRIRTGSSNISIGNATQSMSTIGSHNLSVGHHSLNKLEFGEYNTGIGNDSLKSATNVSYTIAIGCSAGADMGRISPSSTNIAVGNMAGQTMNGSMNVHIGQESGNTLTGSSNTAVGQLTLHKSKGSNNVALGYQAIKNSLPINSNATYNNNTMVGTYPNPGQSITGSSNTGVGYSNQLTNTGSYNTSSGVQSLMNNTGSHNVALGYQSNIYNNGSYNVSIGTSTLQHLNSDGVGGTMLVTGGSENTHIGSYSGRDTQGDGNTCIGMYSNTLGGCHSSTAIGYGAHADISNAVVIGDPDNTKIRVGLGTSAPEYAVDIRHTDRDCGLHLQCGNTYNHSEVVLSRTTDDQDITDASVPFSVRFNPNSADMSFVNTFGITADYEEKTIVGFSNADSYMPALTCSNLGRLGVFNASPEYTLDISGNTRVDGAVTMTDTVFVGDISAGSSAYRSDTKTYFKDPVLFIDGFTVGTDTESTTTFDSSSSVVFKGRNTIESGLRVYGAHADTNNYAMAVDNPDASRSDMYLNGSMLIGKHIAAPENRVFDLDVGGDVRVDGIVSATQLSVGDECTMYRGMTVSGDTGDTLSIGDWCSFDISTKTCTFDVSATLNILGDVSMTDFGADVVHTSAITSLAPGPRSNVIHIYDAALNSNGILDVSGEVGYSFGDSNNVYDKLVQIRSRDLGTQGGNPLDEFHDGKSKNQLLVTSENGTNTSQLLVGSQCDNVDASMNAFVMTTDSLIIGKMSPNDISVSDSSANLVIDPNGAVTITGNNNAGGGDLFAVRGSSLMEDVSAHAINANSIVVHGDISCASTIHATNLAVSGNFTSTYTTDNITADTLVLNQSIDVSNLMHIGIGTLSNGVTVKDGADFTVEATTVGAALNINRDATLTDASLSITDGNMTINNGNLVVGGNIITNDFEINASITASGGTIYDLECDIIEVLSTAKLTAIESSSIEVVNVSLAAGGSMDASGARCTLGDVSGFGNIDVSGHVHATQISTDACTVSGTLSVAQGVSSQSMSAVDISVNNSLDVSGHIECQSIGGRGTVPIGGIIMYSGLATDLPSEWIVCDGHSADAPDLSAQFIYAPTPARTYYVSATTTTAAGHDHATDDVSPYFLFSDVSGGQPVNSGTNGLVLNRDTQYTFILDSDISGHAFNVGTAFKVNNAGSVIDITSSGTGIPSSAADGTTISQYASTVLSGESIEFTIPRAYNGAFQYYCAQHENTLTPFTIADDFSVVYIKRIL